MFSIESDHPSITIPDGIPKAPLSRSGSIAEAFRLKKSAAPDDEDTESIPSPTKPKERLEAYLDFDLPSGILKLRQKAIIDEGGDDFPDKISQLRRTQSAMPVRSPKAHPLLESLQQQTRIKLLNMSTFIPDMKLPAVATAFKIATKIGCPKKVKSLAEQNMSASPLKDSLKQLASSKPASYRLSSDDDVPPSKTKSVLNEYKEGHTIELGNLSQVMKSLKFDQVEDDSPGPVMRRFTDGVVLTASHSRTSKAAPQWVIPVSVEARLESPRKDQLKNLTERERDQMKKMSISLQKEVTEAQSNLMELEGTATELEKTAEELDAHLKQVQREVEHQASMLNILHSRAAHLRSNVAQTEVDYRRSLTVNTALVDRWKSLQKTVTIQTETLKDLMNLTGQYATQMSQPGSPTKIFRNKMKKLTSRRFTASYYDNKQ